MKIKEKIMEIKHSSHSRGLLEETLTSSLKIPVVDNRKNEIKRIVFVIPTNCSIMG
jgi:hypothetical protein